ncbi:RNA recognition motif-containing protein, partial [Coemansia sp. RSA 2673]
AKIVRSVDRVDVATGKARSKGYGFIEFSTHAHALACLRYLNFRNTAQSFSKDLIDDDEPEGVENKSAYKISRRSLRVMFAIENAQVVKKRELRFTLAAKHRECKEAHVGTAQPARPSHASKGKSFGVQSSSRRNGGKEDSKSGRSKHGGKQQ